MKPLLYIGVAAPLVEKARLWVAPFPECGNREALHTKLKEFLHKRIGAYNISIQDGKVLGFRTGIRVSADRVKDEIAKWSGEPAILLPKPLLKPVDGHDYRRAVAELCQKLRKLPVEVFTRIGLTLQQFQDDLSTFKPEMILLICHGTEEGMLLFEDGRGSAEFVPGEILFSLFKQKPKVLFLSACHSEAVLTRAVDDAAWNDAAIVSVDADNSVEVTATVTFESKFFTALLRGDTAGDAFDSAKQSIELDPHFNPLSFALKETPSSEKFRINEAGRAMKLEAEPAMLRDRELLNESLPSRVVSQIRSATDRFVGRRREMVNVLEHLLPLRPGQTPVGGHRRIVTLIKEGGIGKTSIAIELCDWAFERGVFKGGIFELGCERINHTEEFHTALLTLFGVTHEEQKGDLATLLIQRIIQVAPTGRPALLFLDNLDDLAGGKAPEETKGEFRKILESILATGPDLRILATCRWPLGVSDHELSPGGATPRGRGGESCIRLPLGRRDASAGGRTNVGRCEQPDPTTVSNVGAPPTVPAAPSPATGPTRNDV